MNSPAELDARDPLHRWVDEFQRPSGVIYLDGNSLGLLSRRAEAALARVIDQWRTLGIDGWTRAEPSWLDLPQLAAAGVAPLVGAEPRDVGIGGQTTPNLHQLLATLYDPKAPARVIVADALNFASDTYALQSHLRLRGLGIHPPSGSTDRGRRARRGTSWASGILQRPWDSATRR